MQIQIKAIETHYKGYRFRSRLEARWAVFFDTLGIAWRYEEEGYQSGDDFYLPDFRLYIAKLENWRPEDTPTNLFVEVKGDPNGLADNCNYWTELHDWGGILPNFADSKGSDDTGLILLGNIPLPGSGLSHFHPIIQHCKGLWRNWFIFDPAPRYHSLISVIRDNRLSDLADLDEEYVDGKEQWVVQTKSLDLPSFYPTLDKAYKAARSARFEHGESG